LKSQVVTSNPTVLFCLLPFYALGDARADQVPGRGSPKVVEELRRYPRLRAGGRPGLSEIADGLAVSMEHQRCDANVAIRNRPGVPVHVGPFG